jgi:hypothetical protein
VLRRITPSAGVIAANNSTPPPPENQNGRLRMKPSAAGLRATKMELLTMTEQQHDHRGVCPHCHKHDGFFTVNHAQWFICNEHKARWFARFSEAPDDYDRLDQVHYQKVQPALISRI